MSSLVALVHLDVTVSRLEELLKELLIAFTEFNSETLISKLSLLTVPTSMLGRLVFVISLRLSSFFALSVAILFSFPWSAPPVFVLLHFLS